MTRGEGSAGRAVPLQLGPVRAPPGVLLSAAAACHPAVQMNLLLVYD